MTITLRPPSPISISPPDGKRSELPVVQFEPEAVNGTGHLRLRRDSKRRAAASCCFGDFVDRLRFDAWPFFHAAVKTELTRTFRWDDVDRSALFFWGQHEKFFIWNTD